MLTLPNGVTTEYGYDIASQLTSLTYKLDATTLGDLTYTYDRAGNRTTVGGSWSRTGLPTALASATYDAANQIATWGGSSFTYDQNGNLTNDGAKTYSWDPRNQLSSLTGTLAASFSYDGLGRRRAKAINGGSTGFLYDGLNPVQELSGGSPSLNILPGPGIDEWLTRTDATATTHFLTDALGSTLALVNGAGVVQTQYTYEPFGNSTSAGSSSSNVFQFAGRENDGTGVNAFRARFYSPTLQRFLSEDPGGFIDGVNLSEYVGSNPTNFTDPLGLYRKDPPLFGALPPWAWPRPGPKLPVPPGYPPADKWKPPSQQPPPGRRIPWTPPRGSGPRGSPPIYHHDPEERYWTLDDGKGNRTHYDPYGRQVPPGRPIPWWLPILEMPLPPLPIVVNPCMINPSMPACSGGPRGPA